jgi:hypothetical protein
MTDRICAAAASRTYLPVYRMGDGEYTFALSGRSGMEWSARSLSPRTVARLVRSMLTGRPGYHKSGSAEYGFEEYARHERPRAYDMFVDGLRRVAQRGILALALHDTPTYAGYIKGILGWFDVNAVPLHRNNYYHVYSIYALMHGPDRLRLLKKKRVLVATGFTKEKRRGIEKGLAETAVADVQFLAISPQKSLLDVIDLSLVHEPVDIVLVGAGVGSVNILAQLEPLGVPCLDVGFVLSTLGNPELRWIRPFCVPDEDFDPARVKFL